MRISPVLQRHWRKLIAAAFLVATHAGAGPPLSIDDPGTLETGQFEIIVAGIVETRDSGMEYLLPVLDVSYGISPSLLLAVVATRVVVDPDGGEQKSDFGPGALSLKWQFLNRERIQMSVAPTFETLLRDGAADRGILEDTDVWVLPVQFQYNLPLGRINAELRYAALENANDEWGYGIAAAYPVTERTELMLELHGGATRRFEDDTWLYRFGVDYAFRESLHLLASVGSSISEPGNDDIDLQGYLGLQWFR